MKLTSSAFNSNGYIPSRYTCDGEDVNPPLEVAEVPEKTVSLALIVEDPQAVGGNFVHWILYNIDPQVSNISEDSVPSGAFEGLTDFNKLGYGGPCPPNGPHHYHFKLYALDSLLTLYRPNLQELNLAMEAHILEIAELVGFYKKR